MSDYIVINSAYKKTGATVAYKGVNYEIGTDAFATVKEAVNAGHTSDLAVLKANLDTTRIGTTDISSAASDAFAGVTRSNTDNTYVVESFAGSSSKKATVKNEDNGITLNGFANVTVSKDQDATLYAGVQNMNWSYKENTTTTTYSVNVNSAASGSASVSYDVGNDDAPVASVSFGGIDTLDGVVSNIGTAATRIAGTANNDTGHALHQDWRGSYSVVVLADANLGSDVFGGKNTVAGSSSEYEDVKGNKTSAISFRESITSNGKITINNGSANNNAVNGYGTVIISAGNKDTVTFDAFDAENGSIALSEKSSFVTDRSSTYASSQSAVSSAVGSFTATASGTGTVTVGNLTGYKTVKLTGRTRTNDVENMTAGTIDSNIDRRSISYSASGSMKSNDGGNEFFVTRKSVDNHTESVAGSVEATKATVSDIIGYTSVKLTDTKAVDMNSFATTENTSTTRSRFDEVTAEELTYDRDINTSTELDADFRTASSVTSSKSVASGSLVFKAANSEGITAANKGVEGMKSVEITNTSTDVDNNAVTIASNFDSLNDVVNSSEKWTNVPETRSSYAGSRRETHTAVGTATVKGAEVDGTFNGFANVTLDNARGAGDVLNGQRSSLSENGSVVAVESNSDVVVSGTIKRVYSEKIGGKFTAKNGSEVAGAEGYKTVTIDGSSFYEANSYDITFDAYLESYTGSDSIKFNDTQYEDNAENYLNTNENNFDFQQGDDTEVEHENIVSRNRKVVEKEIASGTFTATDVIAAGANDPGTINLNGYTAASITMHYDKNNTAYDALASNLTLDGGNTTTTETILINTKTDKELEIVDFDSVGSFSFTGDANNTTFTSEGYKDVTLSVFNAGFAAINASAGNYVRTMVNQDDNGDVYTYDAQVAGTFRYIANDNTLVGAGITGFTLAGFAKYSLEYAKDATASTTDYTIDALNGYTEDDVDNDGTADHAIIYNGKVEVVNKANDLTITAVNGVESLVIYGSSKDNAVTVTAINNNIYDRDGGTIPATTPEFAYYLDNDEELPVSQFSTVFTNSSTDATLTNYVGSGEVSDYIAVTDGAKLTLDLVNIDLYNKANNYTKSSDIKDGIIVGLNSTLDISASYTTADEIATAFVDAGVDSITGAGSIVTGATGVSDDDIKEALDGKSISYDKTITFKAS